MNFTVNITGIGGSGSENSLTATISQYFTLGQTLIQLLTFIVTSLVAFLSREDVLDFFRKEKRGSQSLLKRLAEKDSAGLDRTILKDQPSTPPPLLP